MSAEDLAIVGLACRLPGASSFAALGALLREGREGVRRLDPLEDQAPAHVQADARYVPVAGVLEEVERFDHAAFGIPAAEAARMDPQHRVLLELAAEALEDAGHRPGAGPVGVYAGAELSQYLVHHLLPGVGGPTDPRWFPAVIANDKDFLPAQIAFRLDLRGPTVAVGGACATGLVALHAAAQALLAGECDLALAGAAALRLPVRSGYLSQPGGLFSADGRTRSFDAGGTGTVYGSGAVVVALRRADELGPGEQPWALLRSTTVHNAGADRAGFATPGVAGHVHALADLLALAGVEPREVQLVEGNGTATPVGDAIELTALAQVFRGLPLHVGSVRSNLGHLQSAAGLAGLLKALWALRKGAIPATLHHEQPNAALRGTGLVVDTRLTPWPGGGTRRAIVSAFGIGGVHAEALLQAPPPGERPARPPRVWQRELCWVEAARSPQPAAAAPAGLEELRALLAASLPPGVPVPAADAPLDRSGLDSLGLLAFLGALEARHPQAAGPLLAGPWRGLTLRALAAQLAPGVTASATPPDPGDGLSRRQVGPAGGRVDLREGGVGKPLLLLPPLGCGAGVWSPLVQHLGGHRLLAPEPPGFGGTEGDSARWPGRLPALLDAVGEEGPVHVLGWSFGGSVALAFALACPERVASLTLVCASARPLPSPSFAALGALLAAVRAAVEDETADRPDLRAHFAHGAPAALDQAQVLARLDLLEAAAALRPPLLLVSGAADAALPRAHAEALRERVPGARHLELTGAGHLLPVTHPAELAAAVCAFTLG